MKNSPEKPEKKKPNSIKILFSRKEYWGMGAEIVWPGENLREKIKEFKLSHGTDRVRIIDVDYGNTEEMDNAVQGMRAMDKVLDKKLSVIIELVAEAVKEAYSMPEDYEKNIKKMEKYMRSTLQSLGLPADATWSQYMFAVTMQEPCTDSASLIRKFARLKGISINDMKIILLLIDKPVLGDNMRIKSVTDLIGKMIGMDK